MVEAVRAEDTLNPGSRVVRIHRSYHRGNTVFPMIGQVVLGLGRLQDEGCHDDFKRLIHRSLSSTVSLTKSC